jgi:hypothetical protein
VYTYSVCKIGILDPADFAITLAEVYCIFLVLFKLVRIVETFSTFGEPLKIPEPDPNLCRKSPDPNQDPRHNK